MKTIKGKLAALSVIGFLAFGITFLAHPAEAAAGIQPTACDNLNVGRKINSDLVRNSALVPTDSGYMRVYYDETKIGIEYYDNDFVIQKKQSLAMELDIWGGFYAGSDGYYLVEGQLNTEESDTAEVIRVIKYDTNWKKQGTAKITGNPDLFGGDVGIPFDYGCVEMAERGNMLYIVTGHEGYVDSAYNQGHQGFLMIEVDKTTMKGSIVDCDLWHSFAQYIACKDSDLYVLEQSEGSRYTKLSKYQQGNSKDTSIPIFKYGGSAASIQATACYASVDGIALSSDHVLCLGTSVDQANYNNVSEDTAYNIYLTVTPMSDFSQDATEVKWFTNYEGGEKCFWGTKITKINDNRFLLSWEEACDIYEQSIDTDDSLSYGTLHYVFIDGQGNEISKRFTARAPISDCQPILKGSNIVYYASNSNMVNFYSINTSSGAFHKKAYRVAGVNATWKLKNSTLTISGTGDMFVDLGVHFRRPVSAITAKYFAITYNANAWSLICGNVKKIVIDGGITSIPERAFSNFRRLTEVQIKSGVRSLGKEVFYESLILTKITIPASVTSIDADFVHKYYQVTIYAPKDSYALKYAKKYGIPYVVSDGTDSKNLSKANISGLKASYAYNGKPQKPQVTVKLNGKKLKQNTDYKVSYANNKNTGKATIEIKGIGAYKGTIKKTFKIVPKKAVISKLTSPKAKTIKLTWKNDSQADGYQIQYATNANFSSGKNNITIKKKTTVSKSIPKLKKNKKYYVHVRAYKKIDGKKCYGSWSKTKQVKCK